MHKDNLYAILIARLINTAVIRVHAKANQQVVRRLRLILAPAIVQCAAPMDTKHGLIQSMVILVASNPAPQASQETRWVNAGTQFYIIDLMPLDSI